MCARAGTNLSRREGATGLIHLMISPKPLYWLPKSSNAAKKERLGSLVKNFAKISCFVAFIISRIS